MVRWSGKKLKTIENKNYPVDTELKCTIRKDSVRLY